MRICVISKDDHRGGGASVVAAQLTDWYQRSGHEAHHLHLRQKALEHPYGDLSAAVHFFKKVEGKLGYRDHNPVELLSLRFRRIPRDYDVVHLHDMSTTLSHSTIGWLAARVAVVWTIHDCSPFTAGCLYPGGCAKFENICRDCPQLAAWPLGTTIDRTSALHSRRRKIASTRVRFTAPSRWMIEQYSRAGFPDDKISFVPNAANTSIFKPGDKVALRGKYGIGSHQGLVLLYSAGWLHDSRKGPREAAALARQLEELNVVLVLVGRYSDEASEIFRSVQTVHLGFIKSDEERAKAFSMCDGTLTFSSEENSPLTAIESLSCGVPVFGYAAGGLAELVINGKTGHLAPVGKLADVVNALRRYGHEGIERMRNPSRERALEQHDYTKVSSQHLELLSRAIEEFSNGIN